MRTSVIIAAHNEGSSLVKTVASCVETCGGLDYEIIVADDASDDGSIDETQHRFPRVRVVKSPQRQGASAAKALGADQAHGDVLVFLDGHTKPERGAIARLAEDVDDLAGEAILTPRIPALNTERWTNCTRQVGYGYKLDLETFDCGWLTRAEMREVVEQRKTFYESPALIGCALAVSRTLYDKLWGFDRQMRMWGVEDLDFGLKCWLLGHRILHDPEAAIGHRFRTRFDNYSVPAECVIVNQLRMARKNFGATVWSQWLEACRQRHSGPLAEHPEGLWARVWELYQADRASVEAERTYLHGHRVRDEFWYAERFNLDWPRFGSAPTPAAPRAFVFADPSPPPCPVTVTFEKDPVKTGYTVPVSTSAISVTTYLRCDPPNAVSDIALTIGGVDRVDIVIQEVIPETGYLIFRVKGTSATPASKPNGDTTIEARYQGAVCASIQAIVIVPRSVHQPFPQAAGNVEPVNLVGDLSTSPVWAPPGEPPLAPDEVGLATVWIHWLTIQIDDQFGDALDEMYLGAKVEEKLGTPWVYINQDIAEDGTYQDPVNYFERNTDAQHPLGVYKRNSQQAQNWPTAPTLLMTVDFNGIQNIPVRVGGHGIGTLRRRVKTTRPNFVEVKWPP